MALVVDTSAVVAVLLDEPTRPAILQVTKDQELLTAPTMPWEIANALSALAKRGKIDPTAAATALELFLRIPVQMIDISLEDVLKTAVALQIYAYDACMIVCAQQSSAPLLTLDRGLRHAAQRTSITLVELG